MQRGVMTADDMARWSATIEAPVSMDYGDWTVHKTGAWGQGPVLLQALSILAHTPIASLDPEGPDFVHLVVEAMKLAYADREAYYGDPAHTDIPLDALLDPAHGAARAGLIGERASLEQRPSALAGHEAWVEAAIRRARERCDETGAMGGNEPTMAHLASTKLTSGADGLDPSPEIAPSEIAPSDIAPSEGDTVHLDIVDRWGNMVSATPSGGWLQSSPCVPGLGFPLNSRAQMFWLEEGLPSSLAPGRRPRTTLTPSLASLRGRPTLAWGSPGGDQQDQWALILFLRHVHGGRDAPGASEAHGSRDDGGMNLQAAIDAPLFHTSHFQGSFDPRVARPGHLMIEANAGEATIEALRARGHRIELAEPWTVGRLTAARRDADGTLRAAATPRLMQAYAAGR